VGLPELSINSSDSMEVVRLRKPAEAQSAHRAHNHSVQFYERDNFLVSRVASYVAQGLVDGEPAVIIATPGHRRSFTAELRRQGIDDNEFRRSGKLVLLDARETLEKFMTGLVPDRERFETVVGSVISQACASAGGSIRAYGEMVDLLWKAGNAEGAIALEELWNDLAATHEFSLLCAYAIDGFSDSEDLAAFQAICDTHTHVRPAESYTGDGPDDELRQISLLQQRAHALETELRHRAKLEAELRSTVQSLKDRERELSDVLETAAEGIHMVSADGTINWANQAELEMLGYPAEEYIGQPITKFHADQEIIRDILARLSRGETICEYEAPLKCRDGRIKYVLINSNVRWHQGEFVTTRCFSKDITEFKNTAAERDALLNEAREAHAAAEHARQEAVTARIAAEDANRVKSEFLAVMSHELRTPLNAIGGYAELMELGVQGPLSAEQRQSLDRIQRNQRHLLGLINQVLNYARIETGQMRYEMTEVPLDQILSTSEALIFPQLNAKGVRYAYTHCDHAINVRADAEKLQQILVNLLANSIKFTERGGLVSVMVEPADDVVRVQVRDTGIGIAPDKLAKIFDPFVQVDSNYTRNYEGVGLGLAVSRDLARGMGARLEVTSEEGKGSTFTLTLRRA
jgi:PAS domain S-box-containing protein